MAQKSSQISVRKPGAVLQYLEALAELSRAYFQLRHKHFSSWSGLLINDAHSDFAPLDKDRLRMARLLCIRVERIASRMGEERVTCLVKTVAVKRMLARRSVSSCIRIGINKSKMSSQVSPTSLEAHAWLELGDKTILGGDTGDEYIRFK